MLPATLTTVNESKAVQKLLTFGERNFERLNQTITIQKCNYLFSVERLIRLTNNLHLLKEHQVLANKLGVQAVYQQLYPVVDLPTHLLHETFPDLPRELIGIIVEYCQFCWSLDEDEDVFYDRLLKLDAD